MKKAFFITIMSALLICSCQKENEEVYSCNKHLNEWAHENLQSIRSMDRDAWLNLDEEYKRPAFNALTPEQKLLFWKDELKEVMTSFEWSEPERQHLMKMYRYLEEHPDIYEPDFFADSIREENFDKFIAPWTVDAMIDYEWTEELLYGILYTGNRMTDKEGHFQIVHKKRVISRKESAPDENCNCNKETEYKNCRGEACTGTERGCGPASAKPCDGKKH